MAVFIKFVMETPGISIGYWKDINSPAQALSSGFIANKSLPSNSMEPEVTS